MRPYMMRALIDWICDNAMTPHVVVDVTAAGVDVPLEHAKDGRMVLNISGEATRGFRVGADAMQFNTRFSGVARDVRIPIGAVRAVIAGETGQGMRFAPEEAEAERVRESPEEEAGESAAAPGPGPGRERPKLRVVR